MSRFLLTVALGASLSSCLSILPNTAPASSVYRLTTSSQPVEKSATAQIIRVVRPSVTQLYNANRIVVTQDGHTLATIAEVKWSEATPDMLQNAMVDHLESTSQFIGLMPTAGAKAETRLHLTVKNFEASFDNGPESAPLAVVQYRVTYVRGEDRSLLGTHTVRETVRAKSINVSSIVAALEQANGAAMTDIVQWLETQKSYGRT